jgi:hypothetical protein
MGKKKSKKPDDSVARQISFFWGLFYGILRDRQEASSSTAQFSHIIFFLGTKVIIGNLSFTSFMNRKM